MPDSQTQRKWLVLAALISVTVAIILVSLHLRESQKAGPGGNAQQSAAAE